MGGIKNKLSKLSNKITQGSPWVRGAASRRLAEGSLSTGLNLTTLTKYLGIACLSLTILSTLILNIVSSYSSSNINSNAEPVSNSPTSTLANTTLDPASISISISSYPSSSSTDSNNPNLSLQIPREGGIAVGRHTVTVGTGSSVIGYELTLSSNDNNETALVNNDASSSGSTDSSDSKPTIPTTTGTLANPSALADKTYGYTLDNPDDYDDPATTPIWRGLQPRSNPATIATVDKTDNTLILGQPNEATHNIYYGVNIQNPEQTRTGNYSRGVLYTAIGELIPEPEVTDLALNSSWTDNTPDTAYGSTSILTGQNLNSVTGVYILN